MLLLLMHDTSTYEERDAITQIFNLYYTRMKSAAYEVVHNSHDAEDAAMNALKYICRHPDMFAEYKSPRIVSLIILCAKTSAIDIFRSNKLRSQYIISLNDYSEEDTW